MTEKGDKTMGCWYCYRILHKGSLPDCLDICSLEGHYRKMEKREDQYAKYMNQPSGCEDCEFLFLDVFGWKCSEEQPFRYGNKVIDCFVFPDELTHIKPPEWCIFADLVKMLYHFEKGDENDFVEKLLE